MNPSPVYFTFTDAVGTDTFVIELSDPALIGHARRILSGEETLRVHIQGTIIQAPAPYNPDWSYHLDPATIGFFEQQIEVCDASISYVEKNLCNIGGPTLPKRHWCPWSSILTGEITFDPILRPPSVPEGDPYILIGRGGGFMQVFTDFVIDPRGATSVMYYHRELGGGLVTLEEAKLLLNNRSEDYDRFLQRAVDIGFFNIWPHWPVMETADRLVISHPDHGEHEVMWDGGGGQLPPADLLDLARDLRTFLATSFTAEFGA